MSLDEEEAKNEHELLADESEDDDVHPGIYIPSTDQNEATIFTYDDHKDMKDDKNAGDIENLDIPKTHTVCSMRGNTVLTTSSQFLCSSCKCQS